MGQKFRQSELLSRSDVSERMLGTSHSIETVVSIEMLFEKRSFSNSIRERPSGALPFTIDIHYINTACTRNMYSAVPTPMDSRLLRFQMCSSAVTAMHSSSGAPCGAASQSTLLTQ